MNSCEFAVLAKYGQSFDEQKCPGSVELDDGLPWTVRFSSQVDGAHRK